LLASCLAAVAVGTYLPFSPLAKMLGFTPLPLSYFAFVSVATVAYLLLVEIAKRLLLRETARNHAAKQGNSLVAT
jgi:Mg2+-importing ATPase